MSHAWLPEELWQARGQRCHPALRGNLGEIGAESEFSRAGCACRQWTVGSSGRVEGQRCPPAGYGSRTESSMYRGWARV